MSRPSLPPQFRLSWRYALELYCAGSVMVRTFFWLSVLCNPVQYRRRRYLTFAAVFLLIDVVASASWVSARSSARHVSATLSL
ncbi:hypothetical protein FB451DRAFT_1255376 [Mycena latifolia]|nr:hypothetical protein FB451DRAFT_1255376 [Mycena latifolia]